MWGLTTHKLNAHEFDQENVENISGSTLWECAGTGAELLRDLIGGCRLGFHESACSADVEADLFEPSDQTAGTPLRWLRMKACHETRASAQQTRQIQG